jgi:hypothetical protein
MTRQCCASSGYFPICHTGNPGSISDHQFVICGGQSGTGTRCLRVLKQYFILNHHRRHTILATHSCLTYRLESEHLKNCFVMCVRNKLVAHSSSGGHKGVGGEQEWGDTTAVGGHKAVEGHNSNGGTQQQWGDTTAVGGRNSNGGMQQQWGDVTHSIYFVS